MKYIDTSVLVACYCPERLSAAANAALAALRQRNISGLTEVEFCSALSQKVRAGELSRAAAGKISGEFESHMRAGLFQVLDIGVAEYGLARGWLARFSTPLRALDALHLAAAFANSLELLTADKPLYAAGTALGVKCDLLVP